MFAGKLAVKPCRRGAKEAIVSFIVELSAPMCSIFSSKWAGMATIWYGGMHVFQEAMFLNTVCGSCP
jgi:hypothetical protein